MMPIPLHHRSLVLPLLLLLARTTFAQNQNAQKCPVGIAAKCYWYDEYPDVKCHEIPRPADCKNLDRQISFIYTFANKSGGNIAITALDSTRDGKTTSHLGRFADTGPFSLSEFIPTQSSVIGENFGSINICEEGALDTTFSATAVINKGQSGKEFTCTISTSYNMALAEAEAQPEAPPPTPVPTPPPTPQPEPDPIDAIPAAELSTEFVRKQLKYKQCRWIAQFDLERRSDICGGRASARALCPGSCSEGGCVRSAVDGSFSSDQCEKEWLELYRHSKLKVKTCGWLMASRKRSNICRKVDEAVSGCPTVCK